MSPRAEAQLPAVIRALSVLALLAAGSAAAQTSGALFAGPGETSADRPVKLTFRMAARVRRPGGSGWISGTIDNRDARAHRVELVVGSTGYGGNAHGARLVTMLEPGAAVDVLLPVSYPGGGWASITLSSGGFTDSRQLEVKADAHMGLLVVAEATRGADLGRSLAQAANALLRPRIASPAEEADVVPPEWLPPRWTLLSGFDAILLDTAVDAEQQRVLVDAVSAGARLLVTQRAIPALPTGPLQERLAPLAGPGRLGWGFGSATSLDAADLPSANTLLVALELTVAVERLVETREASFPPGFGTISMPVGSTPLPVVGTRASGLPFDALLLPLALTTLIAVPTGFFALIVLAYVGFLAWLLVRELRRRTPLRLLVLLPASGGALTVLVLGGGLIAEGTSVRGVSRSFALLDQQAHERVVVGGRTLYAGIGASSSRPQPGTQVVPLAALADDGGSLMLNVHEGGRLDSTLLPARTPVSLALTSVGPGRERLLVRAEADGGLALVAEESFRPREGAGSVVLRLPDGRGFITGAEGRLQAADDDALAVATRALVEAFLGAPLLTRGALGEGWNANVVAVPDDVQFDGEGSNLALHAHMTDLMSSGPAPGSYLARLERGVLLDDLELDIDEELEGVHLVLGRFAPGDVP